MLPHICLTLGFSTSLVAAAVSVCSSGIYKQLASLSAYAPAESYCSSRYPVSPAVSSLLSIITVTTTVSPNAKRQPATLTTNTTPAAWSLLLSQAQSIIKTACSCIETLSTVASLKLTTTTVTKTATASFPTPSAGCEIPSACNAPATITGGNFTYDLIWSGTGIRLAHRANGQSNLPIDPNTSPCEAVAQCAQAAGTQTEPLIGRPSPASYPAFQVYFIEGQGSCASNPDGLTYWGWSCEYYPVPDREPGQNDPAPSIGASYQYSA